MAWNFLNSAIAESGSVSPVFKYRSPPKSYGVVASLKPSFAATAVSTFRPSRTTSGPVPSPGTTATA